MEQLSEHVQRQTDGRLRVYMRGLSPLAFESYDAKKIAYTEGTKFGDYGLDKVVIETKEADGSLVGYWLLTPSDFPPVKAKA